MKPVLFRIIATALATAAPALAQTPLGSAITYQGRLAENGAPANGTYAMSFSLRDAAVGGNQVGGTIALDTVPVSDGLFTTSLDFGLANFFGEARWLHVAVYDPVVDQYVALSPRQPLTATPYAQHAIQTKQWKSVDGRVTNTVAGDFVGINRSTRVSGAEYFGVQAPVHSSYGGMYLRTDGAAGKPFYGYSNGVQSAWSYLDGTTGDWRVNNGGDRLTVTDTGRIGVGTTSPGARFDVNGGGLSEGLYVTNSGSGRAAQFHLPAGASGNALYGVTYGSGRAASFESHVANATPAVSVFKNGGTAIETTGDLEVVGELRGNCGSATARLTPIAYARFKMHYTPLIVIAASPNVTVDPSSAFATVYVHDESDPSTWIVLGNQSFADPTLDNLGNSDELMIYFSNDDAVPLIWIDADCYLRDIDACWDAGLPVGEEYFDIVVYKP